MQCCVLQVIGFSARFTAALSSSASPGRENAARAEASTPLPAGTLHCVAAAWLCARRAVGTSLFSRCWALCLSKLYKPVRARFVEHEASPYQYDLHPVHVLRNGGTVPKVPLGLTGWVLPAREHNPLFFSTAIHHSPILLWCPVAICCHCTPVVVPAHLKASANSRGWPGGGSCGCAVCF